MKVLRKIKSIATEEHLQIIDITDEINNTVRESGIKNGFLFIQTLHTTMGLIVQELTEPRLCRDIIKHIDSVFSSDPRDYEHNDLDKRPEVVNREEEPLNGKAHLQSMILNQQLFLDVCDRKPVLGKWQRIGFLELDGPRNDRTYLVKVWEDAKDHALLSGKMFKFKMPLQTLSKFTNCF